MRGAKITRQITRDPLELVDEPERVRKPESIPKSQLKFSDSPVFTFRFLFIFGYLTSVKQVGPVRENWGELSVNLRVSCGVCLDCKL